MKPSGTLLFFALCFAAKNLCAQPDFHIFPKWQRTNGHHSHTSRDELQQVAVDRDSNIVLVGLVERDSTFGDLMIQKLHYDGSLIWKHRYSSGLGIDYDQSVSLLIDSSNNIYVLGKGSHFTFSSTSSDGSAYCLKMSSSGQLIWEHSLTDFAAQGPVYEFYMGMIDSVGNLQLTYTPFNSGFQADSTYFFTISTDGSLLQTVTKTNIGQAFSGAPAAFNGFIHEEKFGYIIWGGDNDNSFYVRYINPRTGSDQTIPIVTADLPPDQALYTPYLDYSNVHVDANGNIYALNIVPWAGGYSPVIYLMKIQPNGQAKYLYTTASDTVFSTFQDIAIVNGGVILAGNHTTDAKPATAFLRKLDEQGNLLLERNFEHPGGTQNLQMVQKGQVCLIAVANNADGRVAIHQILPVNLHTGWQYQLHTPADRVYASTNILYGDEINVIAGGTVEKAKYPGAVYLTENDFFVEAFHTITGQERWQYGYNDLGTSDVLNTIHGLDSDGNIILMTREAYGPDVSGQYPFAPHRSYIYKYSPDQGMLMWERQLPEYTPQAIGFGHASNFYLVMQEPGGDFFLGRFDTDGMMTDSLHFTAFRNLFVGTQDQIYLFREQSANYYEYKVLDGHLDLMDSLVMTTPDFQFCFQIPGLSDVFTYTITDSLYNNQFPPVLKLFRNATVEWIDTLKHAYPIDFSPDALSVNAASGDFFCMSRQPGNAMDSLYRYDLSGHFTSGAIQNINQDWNKIYALPNGNIYLQRPDTLMLLHPDFQVVATHPLSYNISIQYQIQGGYLMVIRPGILSVFDNEGSYVADIKDTGIVVNAVFNPGYSMFVSELQGSAPVSGFSGFNGRQWHRGLLQAYRLTDYLPFEVGTKTPEPLDFYLDLNPNPVSDFLRLKCPANFSDHPRSWYLSDVAGRSLKSGKWPPDTEYLIIDVHNIPAGLYFVRVQCTKSDGLEKFRIGKFLKQ